MKTIKTACALAVGFALGGCAAQQPTPPPLKLVTEAPSKQDAAPASPTAAELLGQQPREVQEAVKDHENDGKWPIYKTADLVLYPYGENQPLIDCEPLRTTDIQLQPGETITDVAMGDTERWMATPAASGDPRNSVPHLAVKPQAPGIATNLTIYTTKHIYHLMLRSHASHAMQEVEFYYPGELLTAMKDADAAAADARQQAADPPSNSNNAIRVASVDPAQLNFGYTLSGPNVPWKPVRAFDDGSHVYIQMPDGMKTSEAPALLINAGSGTQMVNYRVEGDYYVVDRLFSDAILVSGVGRDQDRVTISAMNAAR
jgi:type IV secretion system protein VirB9